MMMKERYESLPLNELRQVAKARGTERHFGFAEGSACGAHAGRGCERSGEEGGRTYPRKERRIKAERAERTERVERPERAGTDGACRENGAR